MCWVFGQNTHIASLHQGVYMGTGKLYDETLREEKEGETLWWTSIGGGG